MKADILRKIKFSLGGITLVFLSLAINSAKSQSWQQLQICPTGCSNLEQGTMPLTGSKIFRIGSFPIASQSTPLFHLRSEDAINPILQLEAPTIGTIRLLFTSDFNNYGIYQIGSTLQNRFEGRVVCNSNLRFDGLGGIEVIGDQLPFNFRKTESGPVTNPITFFDWGARVYGKLDCDTFLLRDNPGLGKVLVSNEHGKGVWADPSNFNDNDWLVAKLIGKVVPQVLYLNPIYMAVGIGTQDPKASLDIEGNLRVSSLVSQDNLQMVVTNHLGILSLQDIPIGDNLGHHIADKNINLNGYFLSGNGLDDGIYVGSNGFVGIGTSAPLARMDVLSLTNSSVYFRTTNANKSTVWTMNGLYSLGIGVDGQGMGFVYENKDTPNPIMFFKSGKVGVGVEPGIGNHKLFVANGITTEEVKVRVKETWYDNVFETDYKLLPLPELVNYLNNHKHLPDIPSEKDVKQNGIELGEMSALLLKKIEELTLYILNQNKEIEALQGEIKKIQLMNNIKN